MRFVIPPGAAWGNPSCSNQLGVSSATLQAERFRLHLDPHTSGQLAVNHNCRYAADAMLCRLAGNLFLMHVMNNDFVLPCSDFNSPLITQVRAGMLDVLLEAGADINARSQWWAGGFGLLDCADRELSLYAIERGAAITVHAAARLRLLEKLKELIAADPQLIHARGGDGQTPLHFASTVEVAEYLLAQGADIDARDVDHESTPAQYMLRERPDLHGTWFAADARRIS